MKILSSLILSFCLLFAFGIALAETSAVVDENVTADDLGVSESTMLPDNPFYFFKNLGRAIQNALTLDPIKKAELRERFANEKLIELKKLTEKTENSEVIKKATDNYLEEMEKVKNAAEKIKKTATQSEEVNKFLDKFVRQQTLHQSILQKLETKVSTSTMEKIQEAREQHLERFGEVMQKLEDNKEKIQEKLENRLEDISTSTPRKMSTSTEKMIINIRDRIMEKVRPSTSTSACITLWDPVCGRNGKTYSNACFAKITGTEVDYKGACKKKCSNEDEFCGGIAGISCCSELTCEYEGSYPDAGGKCVKKEGNDKTDEIRKNMEEAQQKLQELKEQMKLQ